MEKKTKFEQFGILLSRKEAKEIRGGNTLINDHFSLSTDANEENDPLCCYSA